MKNWVPFVEGEYLVDRAVLLAPSGAATELEDVVVQVHETTGGHRNLSAVAKVYNTLLVELMEEGDQIDLLFDFGEEFKYLLPMPILESGKVFTPGVRSSLKIFPRAPWRQVSEADCNKILSEMNLLVS